MAEITHSSASYLSFEVRVPLRILLEPPSIIGHAAALEGSGLQVGVGLDPAKFPSDNEAIQAGLAGEPLKDIDRGTLGHAISSPATESSEEMVDTVQPELILEEPNADEPVPVTAAAMEKDLNDFAAKELIGFPLLDPAKANEVAAKAAEIAPQIAETFQVPKAIIPKIAKLAYYDHKILCDDSSSMKRETSRIETLQASVRGLFKIGTSLSSDTDVSLVPFESPATEGLRSETDMEAALKRIKYDNAATVPKPLKKRILNPLLEAAEAKNLRPTIVTVITDGDIGEIKRFCDTIARFKHNLNGFGYTGPAVVFLICRVGSDETARVSLLQLKENEEIRDIVLYSEDNLDQKLKEVGKDVNKFAGWVIGELIHALELQLNQTP